MQTRRRFKQTTSLQDRLSEFVDGERAKAESMPAASHLWDRCGKARSRAFRSRSCILGRRGPLAQDPRTAPAPPAPESAAGSCTIRRMRGRGASGGQIDRNGSRNQALPLRIYQARPAAPGMKPRDTAMRKEHQKVMKDTAAVGLSAAAVGMEIGSKFARKTLDEVSRKDTAPATPQGEFAVTAQTAEPADESIKIRAY